MMKILNDDGSNVNLQETQKKPKSGTFDEKLAAKTQRELITDGRAS